MSFDIDLVETQLALRLAATVTDWPIKWPNEPWASTISLSQGGLPLDDNTSPAPFVEAEVISGSDGADVAPAGQRHSSAGGLFRVYLCVPQGVGRSAVNAKANAIAAAFKRTTVYTDGAGVRLTTMDPRIDDGIAGYEDGDRFVRMISTPFQLDYIS